jgi:NADH-quinone oxidoreductase subunit J
VSHAVVAGGIVGAFVLFQTCYFLFRSSLTGAKGEITSEVVNTVGHVELIGSEMFTRFLLPFEVTSILLLAAIVGAVVIAKRNL